MIGFDFVRLLEVSFVRIKGYVAQRFALLCFAFGRDLRSVFYMFFFAYSAVNIYSFFKISSIIPFI